LSVRVLAAAQLTSDELPTSERFTIGGDLYGRAFVNAVASGDQGWGASLELVRRTSKRAELYGFVDGAETWTRERPVTPAAHTGISSAGFGARYRLMERTHLGLELARAVEAPTAATEDDWRFVFSLRTSH
jgi:hemolysin activation/secretion protein